MDSHEQMWNDPAKARDEAMKGDTYAARVLGEHAEQYQLEVAEGSNRPDVLRALASRTTSAVVLVRIVENPATNSEVLGTVVARMGTCGLWSSLDARVLGQLPSDARYAIATADDVPDVTLEVLGDDPEPDVRNAVARNFETPSIVVEMLCWDEAEYVRHTAVRSGAVSRATLLQVARSSDVDEETRLYARERLGVSEEELAESFG